MTAPVVVTLFILGLLAFVYLLSTTLDELDVYAERIGCDD